MSHFDIDSFMLGLILGQIIMFVLATLTLRRKED